MIDGAQSISQATNAPGFSLVMAMMLPVVGILFAALPGGRWSQGIIPGLISGGLLVTAWVVGDVWQHGVVVYTLGGWSPPLGLQLRADGLSAALMAMTSLVVLGVAWYAPRAFETEAGQPESRQAFSFWVLLLAVWAAMNMVFLGSDLFNLYVAIELVSFAAVPLVALGGGAAPLAAALRYLLFALVGSALYLLGSTLLYGAYGTLDLSLLAERVEPGPLLWIVTALIMTGLAAKTALFPLHFWLPPAHASAPPAASALLSALVVKASFFIAVRFWFDVIPGLPPWAAGQLIGAMGAAAILFGGIMALRQEKLKPLIAYSTLAQIGYLFLIFPIADQPQALSAGMIQTMAHAFAKASLFLGAGLIVAGLGHDRIADLRGLAGKAPVLVIAFALAALSLIGVPPTGGFVAKWMLLSAASQAGQWWWVVVILAGGLLTGAYLFRILSITVSAPDAALNWRGPISKTQSGVVLTLAGLALLIGLIPVDLFLLLNLGRPSIMEVMVP